MTRLKSATPFLLALSLTSCASTMPGAPTFNSDSNISDKQLASAGELSGDAALAAGKPSEAADIYARTWATQTSAKLAIKRGLSMRLSGNTEGAVVFLREAANLYPKDQGILAELARSAMAGGYMTEAQEAINKAIVLPNAGWAVFSAQGAYDARQGDLDGAEAAFKKASSVAQNEKDRTSSEANLAILKAQRGDMTNAILDLQRLAARPGVHPKVHSALALLMGLNGDMSGFRMEAMAANLDQKTIDDVAAWLGKETPERPVTTQDEAPRRHIQPVTTEKQTVQPTPNAISSKSMSDTPVQASQPKPIEAKPNLTNQIDIAPISEKATSKISLDGNLNDLKAPEEPIKRPPSFNPIKVMGLAD